MTIHDATGRTMYCEECGERMEPGSEHECPNPGEHPDTRGMSTDTTEKCFICKDLMQRERDAELDRLRARCAELERESKTVRDNWDALCASLKQRPWSSVAYSSEVDGISVSEVCQFGCEQRIAALESENHELKESITVADSKILDQPLTEHIEQLEAALKDERERLDWLANTWWPFGLSEVHPEDTISVALQEPDPDALRQAIDAARRPE